MKRFRGKGQTASPSIEPSYAPPQPQEYTNDFAFDNRTSGFLSYQQPSSYQQPYSYQQQEYTPSHGVYELPDQLAVVAQRSDIRFARALAPPGRYQGEVVSASDYDALRENNDLVSAIGFSGTTLDMPNAESVTGPDDEDHLGGGGSDNGHHTVGMSSLGSEEPSAFMFTSFPTPSSDEYMSATLSAPFSPPGPISPAMNPQQMVQSRTVPSAADETPETTKALSVLTQLPAPNRDLQMSQPPVQIPNQENVAERRVGGQNKKPAPATRRFCCF